MTGIFKFKYGLIESVCVAACMALPSVIAAETVSQKEASRLAQTFFNAANGQVMGKPKLVYNGKKLTTDHLFSPFYVYNLPKGGFVIISAENKAMPILGYSLKDSFNPEGMGEAVKALLSEYARDIEYIRYDSRIPEEAIDAWTNYNEYVAGILSAGYDVTDPAFSKEVAEEIVDGIVSSGRIDELSSDMFTPRQWRDMVDDELKSAGSVALGIIDRGEVIPAVVHGRKGDYYRIELDGRNDWLMRLMATEHMSYGQVAGLDNPVKVGHLPDEEEKPFALHENFMEEIARETESRHKMLEERLHPSVPVVRPAGGGHFEVKLPEEVVMARVYNLEGAQVETFVYRGSDVAHISLDAQPKGFYFVLVNGASGRPYGFKFYK